MIEPALDFLAAWGGLAVRWGWQAGVVGLAVLLAHLLLGTRAPRLRFALLSVALVRFAVPPIAGPSLGVALPTVLTGPAENGLELMVANGSGLEALAWPAWLLAICVGGALIRLLALVRQYLRLRRLRSEAVPLGNPLARALRCVSPSRGREPLSLN